MGMLWGRVKTRNTYSQVPINTMKGLWEAFWIDAQVMSLGQPVGLLVLTHSHMDPPSDPPAVLDGNHSPHRFFWGVMSHADGIGRVEYRIGPKVFGRPN